MKRRGIEAQRARVGFSFVAIWIIGFAVFTLYPMIESLIYVFSDIDISTNGKTFVGMTNLDYIFNTDPYFVRHITESFGDLLYQIPMILIYSTFFGMVLNQKFIGRTLVRVIMFFPVIVASGLVMSILSGDYIAQQLLTGDKSSALFNVDIIRTFLLKMNLSVDLVDMLTGWANNIFQLSWKSGIQIILVLAGLQGISSSVYEAAKIEGATGWEIFWKISLPMISPILLINVVYTVVDSFTDLSSPVMKYIVEQQNQLKLELASTMAWVYSLLVFAVIGVVFAVVGKMVVYSNK
ncbi:MAG: sugar ABC transporter permease [Clostridia bacterium]|nr:sugar ABC transporter permease [Clostridia bacterium]